MSEAGNVAEQWQRKLASGGTATAPRRFARIARDEHVCRDAEHSEAASSWMPAWR